MSDALDGFNLRVLCVLLCELIEEFRAVFRGRKVLDSLLPPLLFLLLNAWLGLGWAAAGALLMAATFALWRLARHQPPGYALGGLGGVTLAILLALLLGRAEGYFLLDILGNGGTLLLALVQVLTGWPATIALLVASYLYGTWRLRTLKGPSVDEFKAGAAPPWSGQRRGF